MTSTILGIVPYGSGVIVYYSIMNDNGQVMKFDSTTFNGTPCVQTFFSIPLTSTATQDLENNINASILSRLNQEFTNANSAMAIQNILSQVSKDLIGTSQSIMSLSIGGVILQTGGTISSVVTTDSIA